MSHKYCSLPTGEFDDYGNHRERSNYNHNNNNNNNNNSNGNYVATFASRIKEQDKNLDDLGFSVSRLGELSLNISKEIDLQNRMLNSLEIEVESAHDKADTLTRRTTELVRKSGGPKWFCVIVILVCILIFLTLLVIYT